MRKSTRFLYETDERLLIYVVRPDHTSVQLKKRGKKEEEEGGESRSSV